MDPAVSSNPHFCHDIRLRGLTQYKSPNPMHFSAMTSSHILARNALGWNFIVRDVDDVGLQAIPSKEANQDVHRVL